MHMHSLNTSTIITHAMYERYLSSACVCECKCVLHHQCVCVCAAVCMCVCVFVYIYICMYVCMYLYVYVYLYIYNHIHVYILGNQKIPFLWGSPNTQQLLSISMCTCVYAYQCACVNGLAYIRMYNDAVLSSSGSCSTTSGILDLNGQNIKSLAVGVFANMPGMT